MRDVLRSLLNVAMTVAALAVAGALTIPAARALDENHQGSIQISYEAPNDSDLQKAYAMAREANALETLRLVFVSFRLPEDLHIKTVGCDGIPNAYFSRENDRPTIRICYEYLQSLERRLPKSPTPEGITPRDALMGQLLFAAAHEFGHAAFDIYNVPVLGRQEDAADQFAIYFLLQFGGERAHRLIRGAAYAYSEYKFTPRVTLPLAALSSDHGTPRQRFYNLVCIAYGYDPKMFGAMVEGYLPQARAKVCRSEYANLKYAMETLITQHIDAGLAEKVVAIRGFMPPDPRAPDDWSP